MTERIITEIISLSLTFGLGQHNWEVHTAVGARFQVCESHYILLSPCCGVNYDVAGSDPWLYWESCSKCGGDRRRGDTVSFYADEFTVENCEEWISSTTDLDPLEATLLAPQLKEELWEIVAPYREGKTYR